MGSVNSLLIVEKDTLIPSVKLKIVRKNSVKTVILHSVNITQDTRDASSMITVNTIILKKTQNMSRS